MQGKQGRSTNTEKDYNVILSSKPVGNERSYALRRLRKDRPDLHKKVIVFEMSPHAAMVEAGFRPKTITVPLGVDKAAAAAGSIFKAGGEEYATRLSKELIERCRASKADLPTRKRG